MISRIVYCLQKMMQRYREGLMNINGEYYLHIFGAFYARTDDTGFDNSVAVADVVYLGSVKFSNENSFRMKTVFE